MKRWIRKLKATDYYDQFDYVPLWVLQKEIRLMKKIIGVLLYETNTSQHKPQS